jgi:hypothetical protein
MRAAPWNVVFVVFFYGAVVLMRLFYPMRGFLQLGKFNALFLAFK